MTYPFGNWDDAHEEKLRNWRLELAVGPTELLVRNEIWTWRRLVEMLRGTVLASEGLAHFYAQLAGTPVDQGPEIERFWYPGTVSGCLSRPKPTGGSLLVYDFEGADPLTLAGWLESQTVFNAHAWCLVAMPEHSPECPHLRFIAPLHTTIRRHELHGLHRILIEYLRGEFDQHPFSKVRPASLLEGVEAWPRPPGKGSSFFHSQSGIVVYADTVLESHPGWEELVEAPGQ